MSASTTLKLPEKLKRRITTLAKAAGKTPHAFMVEALETQAVLAERRRESVASAIVAEEEVAQYGLVYDADEVFSYMKAKLEGRRTKRPKPVVSATRDPSRPVAQSS